MPSSLARADEKLLERRSGKKARLQHDLQDLRRLPQKQLADEGGENRQDHVDPGEREATDSDKTDFVRTI